MHLRTGVHLILFLGMRILALEARKQYPNRPVLPMTFHTQQDAPYSLQVQDQVDTFATAKDYRQTNGFGDPRPESIISYGPISSYEGSQTITPISHASVGASTAPFESTLSGEDEEESNNDSLRLAMTSGIPLIRKIYPEMQAPALVMLASSLVLLGVALVQGLHNLSAEVIRREHIARSNKILVGTNEY